MTDEQLSTMLKNGISQVYAMVYGLGIAAIGLAFIVFVTVRWYGF